MAGEETLLADLQERETRIIDEHTAELARSALAVAQEYKGYMDDAPRSAIVEYFGAQARQVATPEDLALMHYLQTDGRTLPDTDELAPRIDAAERVIDVVRGSAILLLPNASGEENVNLTSLPAEKQEERQIKISPTRNNASVVMLPGLGQAHILNLIGEDDLATPPTTAEEVDALFKKREEEIIAERTYPMQSYLPLIAGSVAVSRYTANLATRITLNKQRADVPRSDRFFFGVARELARQAPEVAAATIEEVRERKPKALELVRAELREDLAEAVENLSEFGYDEDLLKVRAWFETSDVKLFYDAEELEKIKKDIEQNRAREIRERADEEIAELAKRMGSS